LEDKPRDEWTHVWANEVTHSPQIDLPSPLMEEEHVMNHGKPNDLRYSAEETLKRSGRREASITGCL